MKQVRNTFVWIALFSVCGIFSLSTFTQSYQDDFDVLKEENWEHWGQYAIWRTENGILKGWINSPPDFGDARPTIELLQFKDASGAYEDFDVIRDGELIQRQIKNPGYENFTITLKNIGENQRNFGIALGRRFPEIPGDKPFFYMFLTHESSFVRFDVWGGGGVAFGKSTGRVPLNPDTHWRTKELESMELRFNKGHIQWFADGEKRAEFEDPGFSPIEILGFVIIGNGLRVGHAWVDSFKISGPGLSVSPQTKLATTWGKLKQHQ